MCCCLQRRRNGWFKNVFVVGSEKLKVNARAAVEARWLGGEVGATGGGVGAELIGATFLLTQFVFVYWDIY